MVCRVMAVVMAASYCLSGHSQTSTAYYVDVTWDKSDLPWWLQHGNLPIQTRIHEVDDPSNLSYGSSSPAVISEKTSHLHQLNNFPNDPYDHWIAKVFGGSTTITAYGGPHDGKKFIVWWLSSTSYKNNWDEGDVALGIGLDYYESGNQQSLRSVDSGMYVMRLKQTNGDPQVLWTEEVDEAMKLPCSTDSSSLMCIMTAVKDISGHDTVWVDQG